MPNYPAALQAGIQAGQAQQVDFASNFLQGYSLGSQAAARQQQARVEAAAQALRERQAAQAMQIAAEEFEMAKEENRRRKLLAAETENAVASTLFDINVHGVLPEEAFLKNYAGLAMRNPQVADNYLAAIVKARSAPLSEDKRAAEAQRLGLEPSGLDEQGRATFARPRQTSAGTDPEFLKIVKDYETRLGRALSTEEYSRLVNIRLGTEARPAVEKPVTEAQYIDKHLDDWLSNSTLVDDPVTKKKRRATREEGIEALRQEYRKVYGEGVTPSKTHSSQEFNWTPEKGLMPVR